MLYHSRLLRWILPRTLPYIIHVLSVGSLLLWPSFCHGLETDSALAAYANGSYRTAIDQWQRLLTVTTDRPTQIQLHTNLAKAHHQLGQFDRAIDHWKKAVALSRETPNPQTTISLLLEEAQSYDRLGQPRQALARTTAAQALLNTHPNALLSAAAQGTQAQSLMALGELDSAIDLLTQAVTQVTQAVTQVTQAKTIAAALWNNLGNAHTRRRDRDTNRALVETQDGNIPEAKRLRQSAILDQKLATQAYDRSSLLAQNPIARLTPQVNAQSNAQSSLQSSPQRLPDAAIQTLAAQRPSRAKIYALLALTPNTNLTPTPARAAEQRLLQAIDDAQQLGDLHSLSYALGTLGHLYENQGDRTRALATTRQALNTAQQIRALDSLYRWQWQLGRLLPDAQSAKLQYRDAIATLQTLRADLLTTPRDSQLDLRDAVEPLYRELIALLVATPTQANLTETIDTLERLKLTELQNFYGDDCIQILQETLPAELLQSRRTTAPSLPPLKPGTLAVYTIILKTETLLLTQTAAGTLQLHRIAIAESQLQTQMQRLRYALEDISTERYRTESARAYDLLIRPIAPALKDPQIKTLIFVNDGVLRNIPMGALTDGKKFLIEDKAIATTLSLYLTNARNHSANGPSTPQRTLIFGLTTPDHPFSPLPQVAEETANVQALTQGTRFLNADFTLSRLKRELQNKDYDTLHLATHGRFGSDAKTTFLVTHDGRITLDQIEAILRQNNRTLSLLVLSACETATGNDRAALGIAGVAIRTGVQSTLASLWFINDAETVPLITEFYRQRQNPSTSKAEALRQAQLKLLADPQTQHPALWAAFTLIGNWE